MFIQILYVKSPPPPSMQQGRDIQKFFMTKIVPLTTGYGTRVVVSSTSRRGCSTNVPPSSHTPPPQKDFTIYSARFVASIKRHRAVQYIFPQQWSGDVKPVAVQSPKVFQENREEGELRIFLRFFGLRFRTQAPSPGVNLLCATLRMARPLSVGLTKKQGVNHPGDGETPLPSIRTFWSTLAIFREVRTRSFFKKVSVLCMCGVDMTLFRTIGTCRTSQEGLGPSPDATHFDWTGLHYAAHLGHGAVVVIGARCCLIPPRPHPPATLSLLL